MADPQADAQAIKDAQELIALQKQMQESYMRRIGYVREEMEVLKAVGAQALVQQVLEIDLNKQKQKTLEYQKQQLKSLRDAKQITSAQYKDALELAKLEADRLVKVEKYKSVLEGINEGHKKQVEALRSEGKWIQANAKEFLKEKFQLKEEEGLGKAGAATKGAKAAAGALDVASNPGQMLQMLGPWGVIIKFLIDSIDKIRQMGAALQNSAAAAGEAGKGIGYFKGVAGGLLSTGGFFGQMGMTADELQKDAGEIASAGIKMSSILTGGGGMTDKFKTLETFAFATGQSVGAVAQQFTKLTNTFRLTGASATAAYKNLYNTAQTLGKTFEVPMADMINSITSVGEAARDFGFELNDVTDLFNTLYERVLPGTKLGLNDLQKAASALTGIGKSDKSSLAFMGAIGGRASGGFLGALGAAQQRGPGFLLPKMGGQGADLGKQLDMLQQTLYRSTAGLSGPGRQLMMEQIASSQFGLDDQTTEILQKMGSGQLSRSAAVDELKKLQQQAAENKISQKGMLDIIKNFIERMIMKPIVAIYNLLSGSWLFGGNGQAGDLTGGAKASEPEEISKLKKQRESAAAAAKKPKGKRADGGSVTPGEVYEIGERGRELAQFKDSATIIPNNMMGYASGGVKQPVVFNNHYNIQLTAQDIRRIHNAAAEQAIRYIKTNTQTQLS